jgi:hypothetical protein
MSSTGASAVGRLLLPAQPVTVKRPSETTMDLEKVIDDLVYRQKNLGLDSPEYQLINRILTGLRYSYEEAGGIIEDLDFDWGATCRPLASSTATEPRQVLPFRLTDYSLGGGPMMSGELTQMPRSAYSGLASSLRDASGRFTKQQTNNKQQAKLTPSDSAIKGGVAREVCHR